MSTDPAGGASGGSGSASGSANISAVTVSLKLPPFWPADPELWFAQVEAQFSCRRISSQRSRFDHVVACLTPQFAAEVRDLLLKPPADNPYDELKEQLTKRTTASEQRKLQLLFTGEELGDRKPTQLLRRMQQLLGDRPGLTDTSFLQELILQRLPSNVRMVLASTPDTTSLEKLAEMADKVMEVAAPPIAGIQAGTMSATGATPTPSTTPSPGTGVTELTKQVDDRRLPAWRNCSPDFLVRHLARLVVRLVVLPPLPLPHPTRSAGTITHLVIRLNVAANPAPGHQTTRPATSGDRCRRPTPPPRSSLSRT